MSESRGLTQTSMTSVARSVAVLAAAALLLTSCDNAGGDRSLGVSATGTVFGFVYFDANGSDSFDAEDTPLAGAGIRLLSPVSRDTLLRGVTGTDGTFRITNVPIGSYIALVDPASSGDSAVVAGINEELITLAPDDSVEVARGVTFPENSISVVLSTAELGERVFVNGVALNARITYSDTLLHITNGTNALRATRVRPSAVVAGDSVRLLGRVALRDGARVLDDVTVYVLGPTLIPTVPQLRTETASTAGTGEYDAALVIVPGAVVVDTASVAGNLVVRVDDGSGVLEVLLDRAADFAFRPPFPAGSYTAGDTYDMAGVIVPRSGGGYQLRPRSILDVTPR